MMMRAVEQTRDEKLEMYQKLSKRELAEMLVNANDALTLITSQAEMILCPPIVFTPVMGTA